MSTKGNHVSYRLGLDIGSNSIGWSCLSLNKTRSPNGILDIGVRIFSDGRNPKDGTSLAAARRLPRSMRRNRDRYLRRRKNLLDALTRYGLMPRDADERAGVAELDPYRLRADALERRLDPYELGRVVFHLNQRRGFKSNRKTDRAGDNESGLIKTGARDLAMRLTSAGHVTLGQFLADRHAKREGVRIRLAGSGKEAAYPFYPLREMIEAEFDTIWSHQSRFNTDLSPEMGEGLKEIIFHQRPLRDPVVGRCWLEPGEPRGYRAMPSAEAFRIAQNLSHLRLSQPGTSERSLTDEERKLLRDLLLSGRNLTFDQVRKKLKLAPETDFNLATLRNDKLVGAMTAKKLGGTKIIGPAWHTLTLDQQDAAVTALLTASDDEEAISILKDLGIDEDGAGRAVDVSLLEGTTSLSLKAMRRIRPHMEDGLRYDEAVKASGYTHHSDQRTGEVRERLPYYGELLFERIGTGTGVLDDPIEKRWGRAPNPTVHVALNELRRVVNAIIDQHGAPSEIVIETLRDLGRSAVQKREVEREQRRNQDANDRRKNDLAELGFPVSGRNIIRLRLSAR